MVEIVAMLSLKIAKSSPLDKSPIKRAERTWYKLYLCFAFESVLPASIMNNKPHRNKHLLLYPASQSVLRCYLTLFITSRSISLGGLECAVLWRLRIFELASQELNS